MNSFILLLISLPLVEIFLMIKVGHIIGALNTILLILFTAITGIYFAKLQGLSTLGSGMHQLIKNAIPIYEIISGATIAFEALLLILPGFLTDTIGFILIIPFTRKILLNFISIKFKKKEANLNFVEGESEDINDDKK